MISSSDISIIIQGPVVGKPLDLYENQGTQQCIDNIREHLPYAEIIVSTWEGTEIHHLKEVDKIVFSKDPGAITYNDYELKGVYNNNNRQIVSTYAGLKAATKPYAIKFRCDFRFRNTNFLTFFKKYESRFAKYSFFSDRVITCNLAFRDCTKHPVLFAISDLFQFGNTNDLYNLWDIPLQLEPETTRAYSYNKQFFNDPFRFNQYKMKYSSEQYIWYAFSKKYNLDLSLKYFCEIPPLKIIPSIISTLNNFVVVNFEDLGLVPPERLIHSTDLMINSKSWHNYYENIFLLKKNKTIIELWIKTIYSSFKQIFNNYVK
ncbi:TPA: WavE lipopolysaccharide synthesis family protein [Elizabethkingia anophelis]